MAKVTVKIHGAEELKAKLLTLTKGEMRKVLTDGAKDAMSHVQRRAKALAPKDRGTIRRSIRLRTIKRSRVRVGARVTIAKNDNAYAQRGRWYGGFVELGHKKGSAIVTPKEFMRRALKESKMVVVSSFGGYVRIRIRKLMAKKAAKGII